MLRLKEKYRKEVVPFMVKEFAYKTIMAVPKIEKVVLNMGVGRRLVGQGLKERKKSLVPILKDLMAITGQHALLTKAHRSISSFKVRAGVIVGIKISMRGQRACDFLDRLIHIALPRSRDFRGIDSKSIDRSGNLTLGIKEHIIFPEVSAERDQDILSFEITIVTSSKTRKEGLALFKALGFPIKKEKKDKNIKV